LAKRWPALDVFECSDSDLLLAAVDVFSPTALDHIHDAARLFFATDAARDAAAAALRRDGHRVGPIDVDDEDWARRSQTDLGPVTIGRITVSPIPDPRPPIPITIVITPSTGFGTGHHATTRLCLAALQTLDLAGVSMLDVGTGSGILAIAAVCLGASPVAGIDSDPDAIEAARGNLPLNPGAEDVRFDVADITADTIRPADVVTANLTGALLVRAAAGLTRAVRPGGHLVVSGLLADEEGPARAAFADLAVAGRLSEDEWVALILKKP
jgi:ribosomal protein L11 methyltransferase